MAMFALVDARSTAMTGISDLFAAPAGAAASESTGLTMIAPRPGTGEVLQLVGLLGGVVLGVGDGQVHAQLLRLRLRAGPDLHEEGVANCWQRRVVECA